MTACPFNGRTCPDRDVNHRTATRWQVRITGRTAGTCTCLRSVWTDDYAELSVRSDQLATEAEGDPASIGRAGSCLCLQGCGGRDSLEAAVAQGFDYRVCG